MTHSTSSFFVLQIPVHGWLPCFFQKLLSLPSLWKGDRHSPMYILGNALAQDSPSPAPNSRNNPLTTVSKGQWYDLRYVISHLMFQKLKARSPKSGMYLDFLFVEQRCSAEQNQSLDFWILLLFLPRTVIWKTHIFNCFPHIWYESAAVFELQLMENTVKNL